MMIKKIVFACFAVLIMANMALPVHAQSVSLSINVNLDKQPAWGPVGYDTASFYYLPDLNIYFDVNNALFYFLNGGNWVSSQYLPTKYKKYDLYSLYKVVINNNSKPWQSNKEHKKTYSNFKEDKTQTPIRYSPDSKYDNSKRNTNSWVNNSNNGKPTDNKKNSDKNSNKKNNGNSNSGNKDKTSDKNNNGGGNSSKPGNGR